MERIAIKAWVSGIVQGVSFRAYTQAQAAKLEVSGYARNLPDGRVEVLACGEPAAVNQLIDWLQTGSPRAQVTSVKTEPCATPSPQGFSIA